MPRVGGALAGEPGGDAIVFMLVDLDGDEDDIASVCGLEVTVEWWIWKVTGWRQL